MIKVLVADDHKIVVDGIKSFLQNEETIEIVGVASNGEEVLEILKEKSVDIAILDIEMPKLDGIETTKSIKRDYPNTKILILSMYKNRDFILNLCKLGIKGFLLKNRGKEELISAIQTIYRDGPFFPLEIMKIITDAPRKEEKIESNLTSREMEILCLIAEALTAKQIGQKLNIKSVTVETHIRNIKEKLGLNSKAALIRYVFVNKLCK